MAGHRLYARAPVGLETPADLAARTRGSIPVVIGPQVADHRPAIPGVVLNNRWHPHLEPLAVSTRRNSLRLGARDTFATDVGEVDACVGRVRIRIRHIAA